MAVSATLRGKVMTVNGPIEPEDLGSTLPHEHVIVRHTPPVIELEDPEVAIEEVAHYARAGGDTIVEVTNCGIGRNPRVLRDVSDGTGVHIVMGSSYYKAQWHPEGMDEKSVSGIADEILGDIMEGVDGTGIRSGIIGEVGISTLTANEAKVLRASGRAQVETGAPMNLHFDIGVPEALRMRALDILEEERADLSRVATSHFRPIAEEREYHVHMAERGTYVEFDLFGNERLEADSLPDYESESYVIRGLVDRGHLDRILFSSDVSFQQHLVCNGGWGYAHILNNVLPRMKDHGIDEDELHAITVENPRRLLPFA